MGPDSEKCAIFKDQVLKVVRGRNRWFWQQVKSRRSWMGSKCGERPGALQAGDGWQGGQVMASKCPPSAGQPAQWRTGRRSGY